MIEPGELTKSKADAYYDGILKRHDLPRESITKLADDYIRESKGRTRVYYRYTCAHCEARCAFTSPNILYEVGVCSNCNKETSIEEAGFMAVTELVPKGKKTTHTKRTRKSKVKSEESESSNTEVE